MSTWMLRLCPIVLAACGASSQPEAPRAESVPVDSTPAQQTAPAALAPAGADSAQQEIRGVRTTLRAADCETISVDEEAGGSTQRCPGTVGYTLLALDGDARGSITVVDPAGAEHPLEFWTTVTGGFSSLGDEAEWRVRGDTPIALIVPLTAHEDPEFPERVTRYRIVAKLTPSATCVTHRLPTDTPDPEARRLADASASQPCRESYDQQ